MDTKQPEAIRIAEWLEGIRGNTWPSYIPQEAAAELRRLQSENEQLRAGYDAARLEIASLQAQLEAVGAGGVGALMAAPVQPVAPSDATTAVREPCGKIINILAAIVNSPQSDDQFGNEVLQREQVMTKVMEIKAQVDAIYKAAPLPIHPYMQSQKAAAAMTAAPAQAGEYPELPDLHSTGAPFWRAVFAWHDAHHGPEAINAADKLDMLVADMLRAYVDADRAARGAAQAAPVVADVQDEECDVPPFGWRCTREKDHEGPCAAVESQADKDFVERGMRRIRDAADAARWNWLAAYMVGSRLDMDDEIVACESLGQLAVLVDTAIATDGR